MKLGSDRIGGNVLVDIHVDSSGLFSAEVNDQVYTANTRKELLVILEKVIKKAAQQGVVDVTVLGLVPAGATGSDGKKFRHFSADEPFEDGAGVVHAKLRARHASEHNAFLLISESKRKFKISGWGRGPAIARRLSEMECIQYLRLREAVRVADTMLEDFVGSVKLDPDEALAGALKNGGER